MSKRTLILLSWLLILSLVLVACGGGDEDATQEPEPTEATTETGGAEAK